MSAPAEPTPAPETPSTPESPETPTPETPTEPEAAAPEAPPTPPSFLETIDSDLRNHEVLQRYKSGTDLAKAFIEQRQALSKKGFIRPGKDATPQQVRESMTEWGVPEEATPEAYGVTDLPMPEGTQIDPDFLGEALATFHHIGATPEQVRPLLEWYVGRGAEIAQRQSAQDDQLGAQWGKERLERWGAAHDSKFDVAKRAIRYAFPDQGFLDQIRLARLPDGGVLGDHVEFWEGMSRLAEAVPQEHQLLGDKEPTRFSKTPDEAKAEIAKMKADPAFAATLLKQPNQMTQEEKDAVARYRSLFPMAYSTEAQE